MNILRAEDVATVRQAAMVLGGFHKGELARKLNAVADNLDALLRSPIELDDDA